MVRKIFDGSDAVFGRMASIITKELLKGGSVDLINCGEIIISGDKKNFVKKIISKRNMGRGSSLKGPKYIRLEDRLVKRMIRGMLPRDRARGREAFKRLKCHIGKGDLGEEELKSVVKFSHRKPREYSTIKEVVGLLR
ncbi:MAG: uL13 family ribosomal protein [archaeon]|nr:uL13 family ribosomal protein [archaeon]